MLRFVLALALNAMIAWAQWTPQESHTTASLRGIHSLGGGLAWAGGSGGTILRTTNGGEVWQKCVTPSGAEKLDFRAVQAFDANTAVIMSAGTGDLSRLYKTTDGCGTWKLVFSNPDPDGFWDELQFSGRDFGALIGDQVGGHFPIFTSRDAGDSWQPLDSKLSPPARKNQSLFAASNTSMMVDGKNRRLCFITGGGTTAFLELDLRSNGVPVSSEPPLADGEAAGGFSIASRVEGSKLIIVAVGGDYRKPAQTSGTAAFRIGNDGSWRASDSPPRGYRSAVAWDQSTKTWIAVGPNGVDTSTDDGRTWRPAELGQNWNAISLPFVVGSHGAIGKINLTGR